MTKPFTVRLDDKVQAEAAQIAASLGLSFSVAVNMLVCKFVAEKGFPFAVKIEDNNDLPDALSVSSNTSSN